MKSEISKIIKSISERLKQDYKAEKVILYGSYARGEETDDSDIDLFIVASTKEGFFKRIAHVKKLTRQLRNGFPLSPVVLTPEELERRKSVGDAFVMDILEEGIYL